MQAATQAADQGHDPAAFLDQYSEIVHGTGSSGEKLGKLVERFGLENLRDVFELILKAVGDDMSAQQSSGDLVHLGSLLTMLSQMHLTKTFLGLIEQLLQRLEGTRRARLALAAA